VLNDTLSWLRARHTFAFGGEIRRAYNNNISESIGSFTYSSMANFLADKSNAFTDLIGSGNNRILQPAYDVFAQDSFKWKPNFTFNVGLRYAWNSTPSEAAGRFTNFDTATGGLVSAPKPYHSNNKNFQPRIGFAWDPFKTGKTSVRAAYAIMTQAPTTNILNGLSSNPLFALPLNLGSSSNTITLENPFPAGTAISLGPFAINSNFDNAYAQDWNLTIQRQLSSTLGVEVAYVGVKGTHLQILQNINQPLVTNGFYGTTRPFPKLLPTSAVYPSQCGAAGCPLGNMSGNGQVNSGGNSHYNAVWASVNKHFSHGLQFQGSYITRFPPVKPSSFKTPTTRAAIMGFQSLTSAIVLFSAASTNCPSRQTVSSRAGNSELPSRRKREVP
jgi:hypothetical protein